MKRNRYTFGIGTIGRDMMYTLLSMYLIYYLSTVANIAASDLRWVITIIVGLRVFDALNDPLIGLIIDNTNSRFGRHKPWILFGAITCGLLTVLLFWSSGLTGTAFVIFFALNYSLWGITYSLNDVSYWSLLPTLTQDLKERVNIGAKARIFALIGVFFVVAGIVPITNAFSQLTGSEQQGFFWFAVLIIAIMWLGQLVTVFGVKLPKDATSQKARTSLKDTFKVIFKNDQLLYVSMALGLFMIGYMTTTSFGLFYFQYVFGNTDMFSIFAIILGVSQVGALLIFPFATKYLKRKQIYLIATILVVAGYVLFFFSPTHTMVFVGISGVLIFIGQAAIQLLMLLFLADTVDYGHLKLGKRNDSITFSLQPMINKSGSAVASGIVGATVLMVGIQDAPDGYLLSGGNLMLFKIAMLVIPLVCIIIGYLIYHFKFNIDEVAYEAIITDLNKLKNAQMGGLESDESL